MRRRLRGAPWCAKIARRARRSLDNLYRSPRIFASEAWFNDIQRLPTVRRYFWVNEPSKVFVARSGVAELANTILTSDEVRDLVERMLKTSGRRVDLSSPFGNGVICLFTVTGP
jgi:hypothetical protein